MEQIIAHIREVAAKRCNYTDDPDFAGIDYAGGNFDDAWTGGMDDGEVLFARELLTMLEAAKK